MKNGKWYMTEKTETPKLRENQNTQRKGNLQILENTSSWHNPTSGNERTIKKD